MATATKTNIELDDILRDVYADTGDHAGMVRALINRWFSDRSYRKAAEQEIVREGSSALASHFLTSLKGLATGGGGRVDDDSIIEVLRQRGFAGQDRAGQSHTNRSLAAIFWYPLYGGKAIGIATKPEILESAEQHHKQAGGHLKASRREELVAGALPDDQTRPMDCLSAERMQELFEQAEE